MKYKNMHISYRRPRDAIIMNRNEKNPLSTIHIMILLLLLLSVMHYSDLCIPIIIR